MARGSAPCTYSHKNIIEISQPVLATQRTEESPIFLIGNMFRNLNIIFKNLN